MSYEIHPANIPASTEFSFSVTEATCIPQYKITFATTNPLALSLLTKEATATNLGITDAFALTDTAASVKIGFIFPAHTDYHQLVGEYDMNLAVTLKDFPEFDYFLKIEF
jgi:hypothetical protein